MIEKARMMYRRFFLKRLIKDYIPERGDNYYIMVQDRFGEQKQFSDKAWRVK